MKKVIRITESDLIKLVKKSINEGIKISKDERIKLADNKNFLLVIPLSTDAACKYGASTKWCVSGKERNAFKDYQNALLYCRYDNDKRPKNTRSIKWFKICI
jgi:hypothetical protein